jgi:type II secretory pathway pseudopilin PulG
MEEFAGVCLWVNLSKVALLSGPCTFLLQGDKERGLALLLNLRHDGACSMQRHRAAFTMLELLLAIALAVIILALAIPTLANVLGGQQLEGTFTKFEDFVRQAQTKAMKEKRTILIIWNKEGLTLEPEIPSADDAGVDPPKFAFGEAKLLLDRPFALEKKPSAEWPFWRSGTCEPVRITYEGNAGRWVADFDPLTGRGSIVEMQE